MPVSFCRGKVRGSEPEAMGFAGESGEFSRQDDDLPVHRVCASEGRLCSEFVLFSRLELVSSTPSLPSSSSELVFQPFLQVFVTVACTPRDPQLEHGVERKQHDR